MPLPPVRFYLSILKKALAAAALAAVLAFAYAAYLIWTLPIPESLLVASRCSMSVTVLSSAGDGAQKRIRARTGDGKTIEVTGTRAPNAGDQITVWRTMEPDGRFTYEWLENIPPLRKDPTL